MQDWDELTFYPKPPDDATRKKFSTPYNVKICTESVKSRDGNDITGLPKFKFVDEEHFATKWHMIDENLQKIELGKYDRAVREKEKQWHRSQEQKKLLIAVVWGQLDDDTQAQMELATDYATYQKDGDIIGFLRLLCDICNGSDDGGLSYHPFKAMVAIKLLNLYSS